MMRAPSIVIATVACLGARVACALDFVAPAANSIVQPGAVIMVKVAPSPGDQLAQVAFATSDGVTTAAPGVLEGSVRIPLDAVGPEFIIAQGTLVGGGFEDRKSVV